LLNFLWLALGIGSLLVAVFLSLALLRLIRTLAIVEETLLTADEAMKEVVPEIKGSLGNVNDITASVNVGLRTAGAGTARFGNDVGERAARSGRGLRAALFGARVTVASLLNAAEAEQTVARRAASGGRSDG
jgi:hypothetical protein